MARGVNKVIIVGNMGNDPECRYMPSGAAVTNISLATSEEWKDKNSGQKQSKTEWHRVVMFNKLAEIAGKYLKKGQQVYIEGRLQTEKYTDRSSGVEKYTTQIVANEMQMLGSNAGGQSAQQSSAPQNQPAQSNAGPNDFDDDLPF